MREIKFRAWNKETNTMIFPEDSSCYFELSDTGLNVLDMTMEPDDLGFSHIDATIMQYTGLKDKNGVEIYEGDIAYDKYAEKNGTIFYSEGKFVFEWDDIVEELLEVSADIEVIGNIYEHPELLNG